MALLPRYVAWLYMHSVLQIFGSVPGVLLAMVSPTKEGGFFWNLNYCGSQMLIIKLPSLQDGCNSLVRYVTCHHLFLRMIIFYRAQLFCLNYRASKFQILRSPVQSAVTAKRVIIPFGLKHYIQI